MAREYKRRYVVDTHDYGRFYCYATCVAAARARIAFRLFGYGYDGNEHEYWETREA